MTTHRIALVTTGGTINGWTLNPDAASERSLAPLEAIEPRLHVLSERLGLDIAVEELPLCDIDSSDMHPSIWTALIELIGERYDDFDSFIIFHGTNTLGYTSAALSFGLVNPGKPIVLTGSQVQMGVPGSDALTNFENAVRVAVWRRPESYAGVRGVVVVFGSHIIPGTRVKKGTSFDYDAMVPFSGGSIGRVGRYINIDGGRLSLHNNHLVSGLYQMARGQEDLRIEPWFDMRIASLTEFPGMSTDLFTTLIEQNDLKGIIFRSYGAGDPASTHRSTFEYLRSREIPIVVTTQVPNGTSNFQVNESGAWLAAHRLAIPAHDMGIEAQTAKLAWLLAKRERGELTYDGVCQTMVSDLRGEINVLWESGE